MFLSGNSSLFSWHMISLDYANCSSIRVGCNRWPKYFQCSIVIKVNFFACAIVQCKVGGYILSIQSGDPGCFQPVATPFQHFVASRSLEHYAFGRIGEESIEHWGNVLGIWSGIILLAFHSHCIVWNWVTWSLLHSLGFGKCSLTICPGSFLSNFGNMQDYLSYCLGLETMSYKSYIYFSTRIICIMRYSYFQR